MSRNVKQMGMREHIKKRSMWAGSKKNQTIDMYMYINNKFTMQSVKYPPAMYKCIDEIIVNAIDHYVCTGEVSCINITLNKNGVITVMNDGPGIEIKKVKNLNNKEMYTVQLIFSEMLSGSNLDDEFRIVGGQNGLGAKITGVYSKWMKVITVDAAKKKMLTQMFRNGLEIVEEPKITTCNTPPYTEISFLLDYKQFDLGVSFSKYYPTLYNLIMTRAVYAAAYTNICVKFNDKKIHYPHYKDFVYNFVNDIAYCKVPYVVGKKTLKWEVAIGISNQKEQHIGMVNGICCHDGTHFKYITGKIIEYVKPKVEKIITKDRKFNKNIVLNNMFVFAKCTVPNPDFSSQSKDILTTPIESFKTIDFPTSFYKNVWELLKTNIINQFIAKQLGNDKSRTTRSKLNVAKYREANFCRSVNKFHKCGLIIAEGDSAMGTAREGLLAGVDPYFNYDYFGTFCIQGVPMNGLKESSIMNNRVIPKDTIKKNERLSSLIKVLGLNFHKTYETDKEFKTLRYGFIVGLVDQDLDGFNIFGLLCTFFMTYWPKLVERGFIRRINTPLIRAYPKNRKRLVKEFYSETEFNKWSSQFDRKKLTAMYNIKYYKGLGTHKEAYKEVSNMFKNIKHKICTYVLDRHAIDNMHIYYGKNPKLRKNALVTKVVGDATTGIIKKPLSEQFNVDTKLYQIYNISRKARNIIDGFITSHRKVFFTARQLGKREIKVQGLSGETVAKAKYHHGEASLEKTIVRMAQAYPTMRNLPLLLPLGNFGSRGFGFKDYAASRYIFTTINSRLANCLFRKEDDYILNYKIEEDERCEPEYYAPIIPYVICENESLPATGWAIKIVARDINQIISVTKKMINGVITHPPTLRIDTTYFKGDIRKHNNKEYFVGVYEYDPVLNKVSVTELPPDKYSDAWCFGTKGVDKKKYVKDVIDNTTLSGINIMIQLEPGAYEYIEKNYGGKVFDSFEEYFGLKSSINHNLNFIDEHNKITCFTNYEDIYMYWWNVRKKMYETRINRERIIVDTHIKMLKAMQKFSKTHSQSGITNRTTEEKAIEKLKELGYKIYNKSYIESPRYISLHLLHSYLTSDMYGASYDYLLNMNYKAFTKDAYDKRQKKIDALEERNKLLHCKERFTGAKIWLKELNELEKVIHEGRKSQWFYGDNNYRFE